MTAAPRKAPISSHPAFKWSVAAWFALLLGLGLFVMPSNLHDTMATSLGLSGFLPDPDTKRIALSAAGALVGLLVGLALALRVTSINDVSEDSDDDETSVAEPDIWLGEEDADDLAPPSNYESEPRRPFNPREDMEEAGIGSPDQDVFETEPAGPDPVDDSALMELWHKEAAEDAFFEEVQETEAVSELPDEGEPSTAAASGIAAEHEPGPAEQQEEPLLPASGPRAGTEEVQPVVDAVVQPDARALGDLSLDELTARLGSALEGCKTGNAASADETDPVIAFLRREAERETPKSSDQSFAADPQAELRSALEKLSRVGKPK